MKDHRVAKFMMVVTLGLSVLGLSGSTWAQDQAAAPSLSSEPALLSPPAPKAVAPRLPAGAPSTTAVLSVTGTALRPQDSSNTFAYAVGGYLYAVAGRASDYFNTPIYLPQGAVVTSIRMYSIDWDSTHDCIGLLSAYKVNAVGDVPLAWVTSSGSSGFRAADSGTISHTIDYHQYSYLLEWSPQVLGSNMMLGGFSIFYTPPPGKVAVIPLY